MYLDITANVYEDLKTDTDMNIFCQHFYGKTFTEKFGILI